MLELTNRILYYNKDLEKLDLNSVKKHTLSFIKSMRVDENNFEYLYSSSTKKPTLYSSLYSAMTLGLYDKLVDLSGSDIARWISYINCFQNTQGMYIDQTINNGIFLKEDWWGMRHLAVHALIALTRLGSKTKCDFAFLRKFYGEKNIINWLESRKWNSNLDFISNKIMNLGVLLQYSRDSWGNHESGKTVKVMKKWLLNKINSKTGLWGNYDLGNVNELSKAVQAAYHIWMLLLYDKEKIPHLDKAIDNLLRTQNRLGGYGVEANSGACEDIDAIVPLIKFSQLTNYRKLDIEDSLKKTLPWVVSNMRKDGGFVFKKDEPFRYGHDEMYSGKNEPSMFATWFRTLTIAYLVDYLFKKNIYKLIRCPGYEF